MIAVDTAVWPHLLGSPTRLNSTLAIEKFSYLEELPGVELNVRFHAA